MSISCSCDFDGDAEWYWDADNECIPLKTKRARKCCSCGAVIKPGEMASVIGRYRRPNSEIEDHIYGEGGEVRMAFWFHCHYCASLASLVNKHGACYDISGDIQDQLIEHVTYGESCHDGQDPAAVLLHDLFATFVSPLKSNNYDDQ